MKLLGTFEHLSSLFPKKIETTFIEAITGEILIQQKVLLNELPLSFDKPIVISLNGNEWRVVDAKPKKEMEFIRTRKLILYLQPLEQFETLSIAPTVVGKQPRIIKSEGKQEKMLELHDYKWRQIEFLPAISLPIIHEEVAAMEATLQSDFPIDNLLGYRTQYVREKTKEQTVQIPFLEFCSLVNIQDQGNLSMANSGWISDGFWLRTENHVYYGVKADNSIQHLCLATFNYTDEELISVLLTYGLVLVDWCERKLLLPNEDVEP